METHPNLNNGVSKLTIKEENNELLDESQSFCHAIQLVNSITLPMSLHAAMEIGVFDIIHKSGPNAKVSAEEIASKISSKNPDAATMVDRILFLLSSFFVLDCSHDVDDDGGRSDDSSFKRLYSLNSVSRFFVPNEDGVSLRPLMGLVHDKVFIESWNELKDAILEGGIPFNRVHEMSAFEYPRIDKRFNQVFNDAMSNCTILVAKQLLISYKGFEHINNKLVDVGGGLGTTLSFVTSKYPKIQGINFDLPHVINEAPSYPGVEHVGGNMFESVPQGDAIFMKMILHDWSDEHCVKLLKNCYNAIPENGKVIVVEQLLPTDLTVDGNSISVKSTCETDVLMMTQNPGGKERTQHEFMQLANRSGFKGFRLNCVVYELKVMEFFK